MGLAHGLSGLADGPERYVFLCRPGETEWLRQYVSGPCSIIQGFGTSGPRDGLPVSDGTLESLGAGLIHFTRQDAFLTQLPSIYQPWDLQHLHLPSFFEPDAIASRERRYRAFCSQARNVVVASSWGKADLVEQYGLAPDRITVIGVPAPTLAYAPPPSDGEVGPELPHRFILYPAQTWRHKNHLRLLEALARLRDQHGLEIDLVCTGTTNEHFAVIQATIDRLGLRERVHFLGFISTDAMQAVYRRATALVFPSLFEGWGLPVIEAVSIGLPVACSRVTSLPEVVDDAALLFDPTDVAEIASAIERLWTDADLRDSLASRGRVRAAALTWDGTARAYRSLYRATAGWPDPAPA